MKIKTNDSTHMFLLLIALATFGRNKSETLVSESYDYDTRPSFFYKGKFLHFFLNNDRVHVYEEGMIPYSTKIRNVLFPNPHGNITDIYTPIKDRLIVAVTNDGKKWLYERLKLRRTEESPAAVEGRNATS